MERVVVTQRSFLCMQVCAVRDATDEEIISVCEKDSPCGTTKGWGPVVREGSLNSKMYPNQAPVICYNNLERIHFIVLC